MAKKTKKKMEIHLKYGKTDLELPVLPESFELSGEAGNEQVTIHTTGEITLIGKPKLSEITIESSFPKSYRSYQNVPEKNRKKPYAYVRTLRSWMRKGRVCRLTITNTNISTLVTIEGFTYGEEDSTGDVVYSLELKEYREHKVKKNGSKTTSGRSSSKGSVKTYKVKKGDTLKKIAKKTMGKTSYSKAIYNKNKKVIEAAWTKYRKAENKKRKAWNKRHPSKKKALIKDKTSKKGKHLVPGTKLTIPKK